MAFGDLTGIGKLVNNNGDNSGGITLPKLNLMTIGASRYGFTAEFSVFTTATTIQGLFEEMYTSNLPERRVINHKNANQNLGTGKLHTINLPYILYATTYDGSSTALRGEKVLKIGGQITQFTQGDNNWVNTEITKYSPLYIFPYGGGNVDLDAVIASILHIQELI